MDARAVDFEARVLPHLDAAYNLARWLLRDAAAADDVVQDACLRAMRYLGALRDGDARPWLLGIVRNLCFDRLAQQRSGPPLVELEDDDALQSPAPAASADPLRQSARRRERELIDRALRALSPPFREVIVLREMEELSYEAIAEVVGIPVGTVMSRLSRARALMRALLQEAGLEGCDER